MWRNLVSESIEAHYQLCSIFPPSFFFRFSWPPRAAFTARCPFLTGNRRARCVATSLELRRILPCYSNTDILLRKSGGELSSVASGPSGFRSISRCSWFSLRITRDLIEEIGDIGKLYMVVNPADQYADDYYKPNSMNNAPCISRAWIIILLRFFAVLFSEGLLWYWICYVHSG